MLAYFQKRRPKLNLSFTNSNLILVALCYQIYFNIIRQVVFDTPQVGISANFIFIALFICAAWQGSTTKTFAYLFGRSTFNIRDKKAWFSLFGLMLLTVVFASFFRFGVTPAFVMSWQQKICLFFLGPYSEEAIGRCLVMKALSKYLPSPAVLLLSITYWLSIHSLPTCDPAALVIFAVISSCCYFRFCSLNCCFILHSLWNSIIQIGG